tara:strand:+ start:8685 stop:9527 length:843 start_codon:yes stop_codon:yes gene_type:complete
VLENCRFNIGEKSNSIELAEKISNIFDVYVNDAFATAHRKEVTVNKLPSLKDCKCAGFLFMEEINALQKILANPSRPLVAIVGGSKISGKLELLFSLLEKVDTLIVGGGIANTLLRAKGFEVGNSLHEKNLILPAQEIHKKAFEKGVNLPLPRDVVTAISPEIVDSARTSLIENVQSDHMILDFGPKTLENFEHILKGAGTILWNGPVGLFEVDEFSSGTRKLAEVIGQSGAYSIVGGGDTVSAINKFHVINNISYISTGGGAFLEFLRNSELPAVRALF